MSTTAARRTKLYTFEDFCALIPDGQKADLIDGVIYMASPDSIDNNDIGVWLLRILADYVDELLLGGKLSASRVAYRLDKHSGPEPDIGYIGPGKLEHVFPGYIDCAPDVAIEIVSQESKERDYVSKRDKYEKAGVREYWIIDPLHKKVTFLRLGVDGLFKQVRPRGGVYTSKVIPGFWFRPEWLWQEPLPSKKTTLSAILAAK